MHQIPIGSPPSLVHSFGAFGESIHGLTGPEAFRNAFWVLNLVSNGSGTLEIGKNRHPFGHRWAVLAPPDTDHLYRFDRPVNKVYAHFRVESGAVAAPFPVAQDLGDRFDWFQTTIFECRSLVAAEPERAMAMLWNLLWQLAAGPAGGSGPRHHPAVKKLMSYLEAHIGEPLDPEVAALHAGCSVTHLNRLCRAAFGLPLATTVRRLRLDRAVHLLSHTSQSIAAIATVVGLPDLQHFNKLIRRHMGKAPRQLRRG